MQGIFLVGLEVFRICDTFIFLLSLYLFTCEKLNCSIFKWTFNLGS
jgi:hypothetical protein